MNESYPLQVEERLRADSREIVARYPVARSALMPMLHLVQSVDGFVSPRGIALCADVLGLSRAEVSAVATFYSQYRRHPNGEYNVGVCTNCAAVIASCVRFWGLPILSCATTLLNGAFLGEKTLPMPIHIICAHIFAMRYFHALK